MRYVALLRGINVGGKNRVEMERLRDTFAGAGAGNVRTYINSGNVIFDDARQPADLAPMLEEAIAAEFGFPIKVLIRDLPTIETVASAVPDDWVNDKTMRTDVFFLWDDLDSPDVLDDMPVRDGIDEAFYVNGAVVWRVDAENVTRSGRGKIIGGQAYRSITVRNINTLRKLHMMMAEDANR